MNKMLNPKAVRAPAGAYSHTVKVPKNAEWLLIAGQIGVDVRGQVADGIRKQADQTFRNILACLKANGLSKKHLVKFTVFLTDARYIAEYRAARKRFIGDAIVPTSTLLIVEGLAAPELQIEIEAWAAKA